jgi:ATP-dependent DNA helicase RecG
MVIESAERFGLSQLHQLRGRVGRGAAQSYCMLITQGEGGVSAQRAAILEESGDGFVIAEKDLELRGPGEFFGLRQHGIPQFRLADPVRHSRVLYAAREEAQHLLREDPLLEAPAHAALRKRLSECFDRPESPVL